MMKWIILTVYTIGIVIFKELFGFETTIIALSAVILYNQLIDSL